MQANAALFAAASSQFLSASSFSLPSTPTVSFWFYGTDASSLAGTFTLGNWGNSTFSVIKNSTAGALRLRISNGSSNVEATSASGKWDGLWHHIVAYQGADGKAHLWVDGVESVSASALTGSLFLGPSTLTFGHQLDNLSGAMDEVGVWSRVLTADERAALYNYGAGKFYPGFGQSYGDLSSGLTHYWALGEASGTRADSVGGVTLTDNNTVGSTTGKNSNAALFVTANSESLSDNTINPGDTDYSFSLWINPTSLSTYALVARDGPTARTFLLDIEASKAKFYRLPTDAVTSTITLTTGAWYHIYAYHDSVNNQIGISVNGETLVTAATTGASNGTAGENFRVGARDTGGSPLYFNGAIDELGMWSRVLTATERTALYNAGAGKFYPSF